MVAQSTDSFFPVRKYVGLHKGGTERFRLAHVQECNNLVADIAAIVSRSQNRIQILTKFEKRLWPVRISAKYLQYVLLELTLNAIEAIPDRGKIIFKTRNVQMPKKVLRGTIERTKWQSYVEILISDTGCGMSPEQKKNMFRANYTTKDPEYHMGNGLPFSLKKLKQMKGTIQVYSCVGIGTVVKVLIPTAKRILPKERQTSIERRKECSRRCVLIVDDDIECTDLANHLLSRHGYQVKVATSAAEGKISYKLYSKKIDLVLLDLTITGADAYDLLKFFWDIDPDQKILATVGVGEKKVYEKLAKHDFSGFIQKPYFPLLFVKAIKQAINKS